MNILITSEVLLAYSLCPRKAYLLMYGQEEGELHEYERIIKKQQVKNETQSLAIFKKKYSNIGFYSSENIKEEYEFLIDANLSTEKFQAYCPILKRTENLSYEPEIFIGTYTIHNTDKIKLLFIGHILEKLQNKSPQKGYIINLKGESRRINLVERHKVLRPILEPLLDWLNESLPDAPPLILNKHCSVCQFKEQCQRRAIEEDNLSLLDRMTPKKIRQYEKKGIFSIQQLSFLFKPRKRKKRAKNTSPIIHNFELQALAIRTKKIYLKELPDLDRQEVELYLDIEGLPEQKLYYLIGLLVFNQGLVSYHSFWADSIKDEEAIWQDFLNYVAQYPNTPIYHYGSYESRAIAILSKRYKTQNNSLTERFININKQIYGKVYFPLYSNRLKEIGNYLGSKWTLPEASGLQSLVWRYYWEKTESNQYKSLLKTYNKEDCEALLIIVQELTKIKNFADSLSNIDFADKLKKQKSKIGEKIQNQFGEILKFAHRDYDKKKIRFNDCNKEEIEEKKKSRGIKKGYPGQRKKQPKISKVINVNPALICPKHQANKLQVTNKLCKRVIIDLVITSNGIKKIIPQYIGAKSYCQECDKYYNPPTLLKYAHSRLYGHGFKAWTVYHRVAIKIPYESICEMFFEQFGEVIHAGTIVGFIKDFANYYSQTENEILKSLLKSPTIHVDETRVNIKGFNWYGWVFANENYVIFKLTETREAKIVHDLLSGFQGVLVSDFYSGYDSVNCIQQKCWVHLIRDLNEDLNNSPFDFEYEKFVLEVKNLIIPIMIAIQKYGLKNRHLKKFKEKVDKFYKENILDRFYKSDVTLKYQKRFTKYKNSLFTFLDRDGIAWNNNLAERAIRPVAVHRDASTPWHEASTRNYFVLLGIQQTCCYQNKSFFQFLFSTETDLENFKSKNK